ncbi:hypothetical protein [Cupriavidus pampae]|uniref:Uncharacterized protein n=1 Tax=Cupriavidus pampae TaxID=659251 RepID=A0ABN7ZG39_9BURK|nr:hypothetical protein [Cupriavidus pampae]CAG9184383.1 hypothetical protein LMG32289_05602 [Cupriavidus pampae]
MSVTEELLTAHPMDPIASEVEADGRVNHFAPEPAPRDAASPMARRAYSALRIMAALIKAVVVHPGSDSSDAKIVEATNELLQDAHVLTDTMVEFAGLDRTRPADAEMLNSLSTQSAEIAALNWRLAYATGKAKIPAPLISDMIQTALDKVRQAPEPDLQPSQLDLVTAQRVALLSIVPDLQTQAVHSFDYFVPDVETLVQKGLNAVLEMTEYAVERLRADLDNEDACVTIARALIPEMGAIYVTNYRHNAKKDVESLRTMDHVARHRRIHEHRFTGLPTEHIDESFRRLARRMVDMIIEAVPATPSPYLSAQRAAKAGAMLDRSHL